MPIEVVLLENTQGAQETQRPLSSGSMAARRDAAIAVTTDTRRIVIEDTQITVSIPASKSHGWVPIARTSAPAPQQNRLVALAGTLVRWWWNASGEPVFEWSHVEDGHRVTTHATISQSEPCVRISAEYAVVGDSRLGRFDVTWEFLAGPSAGGRPDFLYTPCLCPEDGEVVGQHMFRSPAAIAQHKSVAVSLLPDLESLESCGPVGAFLELLCPKGRRAPAMISYGLAAYRVTRHVYFTTHEVPPTRLTDDSVRFSCGLRVDTDVPERRAYQAIVRALWDSHGRRWLQDVRPQTVPFERYYQYAYDYADRDLWRETTVDGRRVGAMTISREYRGDVWFQGWFNQLRTAWGLYWWASRSGDEERMSRALATRDLVLSAPQDHGLFPTIAVFEEKDGESSVRWVASSLQGGGPDLYHLLDNSWVAFWLLRWHNELVPDDRSLDFCTAYGQALLELQSADGSWPDYLNVRRRECAVEYDLPAAARGCDSGYVKNMVHEWGTARLASSAETATSALFLAELSRCVDGSLAEQFLDAAKRAAEFLSSEVIPRHKWLDFETFFSCSPKPLDFYDRRTHQHPQNTLSLYWAAEAFRVLAQITGGLGYREQAISLMDYLCLYQQVWSPPYLTLHAFGGFGVMNTDGEWNDARQAVFADGLMEFYQLTGRREYLERAVAATRASFATAYIPENAGICPKIFDRTPTGHADENYAHGGHDTPAGPTGLDWGIGSGLTAAARLLHWFGDVWVDEEQGWALGTDGITAAYQKQNGSTDVALHAPFRNLTCAVSTTAAEAGRIARTETGQIVIRGTFAKKPQLRVLVNSREVSLKRDA